MTHVVTECPVCKNRVTDTNTNAPACKPECLAKYMKWQHYYTKKNIRRAS